MPVFIPLTFDSIAAAENFVADCRDENPVSYGIDAWPALPTRRGGVHREPRLADGWDLGPRAEVEDRAIEALDARADGGLGDCPEGCDCDRCGWIVEDDDDERPDECASWVRYEPMPDGVPARPAAAEDPREEIPAALEFAHARRRPARPAVRAA